MHQSSLQAKIDHGVRHQRAGRFGKAMKSYQEVLAKDPRQPDALHYMGVLARDLGNLDDAVELIAESLRVQPNNVVAINNLASALQLQKRLPEALEFYDAAIAAAPDQSHLHCNRGNVLKDLGFYREAIAAYDRALQLDPESHAALSNLGIVYRDCGEPEAALICYRRAIELNPESHEAHSNLGILLREQGKAEEAVFHLYRAVTINPKSDAAFSNLGTALKDLGRGDEAVGAYCQALELNPNSFFAMNNLGILLRDAGRFPEAAGFFEKAIAVNPSFHIAHSNLGTTLCELGRTRDAVARFQRALELKPTYHPALSNLLFALNYLGDLDRAALYAEHRRFDELFCEPLKDRIQPHANRPDPQRRLRVGFVSADLREHSMAGFIEPVFAYHDREQFEYFCYSTTTIYDSVSARLRSHVEHWRLVVGLTDDELAAQIRQDEIDILVDLSGHTAGNRLLVFARKPAPVQVSMIGYMQTTGLSAMDYRITDERLDPVGETEAFNSEELVRIPEGAATFSPPLDSPEVGPLPALGNGFVTFGSFNNLAKVSDEAISAWAEILQAMPTSRLIVVGRAGNGLRKQLEACGIDPERLELIERQPMKQYLALHQRVDILLDTFPYNGGTTNLLALWMGVPYVTLEGEATVSRTGAGILLGAGLTRLVASSRAEYVAKAQELAADLPALAEIRAGLRETFRPSLHKAEIFTRQLQDAFREMWRKWCGRDR